MRRIESKEILEDKQKKRTRIFTFVVLGLLVLSSLGYAFLSNPGSGTNTNNTSNTGNEKVQQIGNQWVFQYGGQQQIVSFSPESVKDIEVNISAKLEDYAGQNVYLASNNSGVENEIGANLRTYASKIQRACYLNCEEDLPNKNCNDNLIVWREGQANRVYQQDKCVFIEGDLRAVDAFLYKVFGIE